MPAGCDMCIARGKCNSDDGMTVIEIVIASFILFFVLTAVLGLVSTTTRMGISAKERTAITNAMSSHMEWIRSLDFDEVALQGTTTSATVPAQTTMMIDGFTVVITTSVSDATRGVKEVQVDAVATHPAYSSMVMSQHVSIRDYSSGLTQMVNKTGPRIDWDNTPAEGTVVYSRYVTGGALLNIDIDVETGIDGVPIADLRFYCSGQLLRDGSSVNADVAAWQPNEETVSKTFNWNTLQVDDQGNPDAIADGWRTIRIEATDAEGNRTVKERRFLVDNDQPGLPPGTAPTSAIAQVMSDIEARLGWAVVKDGTDDSWGYGVKIYKVNISGTPVLQNSIDAEGQPLDYRIAPTAYIQTTTAFSRYTAAVRAYSPRLMTTEYAPISTYVTKPKLTGTSITTYAGKNAARTSTTGVNVAVTPPTFGCATITYDLFRSLDPANLGASPYKASIGSTYTDSIVKTVGKFGVPDAYYYRYRITYTAAGSTGSGSEVIWSNVIGPTTAADNVYTPMPFVSW